MAYNVLRQPSPNHTPRARVRAVFGHEPAVEFITGHWWGDPNNHPSAEGVVSWLTNPRSQVAAHVVATGTGRRVWRLVNDFDAAWHAGHPLANARSTAAEVDPRLRASDYDVLAEWVADMWIYYGREIPLRVHREFTATACPGHLDVSRVIREARVWRTRKTAPAVTDAQIRQAYRDILERDADAAGIRTYLNNNMSIDQIRNDLRNSNEYKNLQERKRREAEAAAKKVEWTKNLKDHDEKLTVLRAEGAYVVNLETNQVLPDTHIPRGTVVDVKKKTTAYGRDFYITSWSAKNGTPNGIPASYLGVPAEPPKNEKPEWLENLDDIKDLTMYARMDNVPVLNIENGDVVRYLQVNEAVLVTHATHFLEQDFLVLDGKKEVIETRYLNDKKVEDPDSDIEERLTALEAIIKAITDFLSKIFKGWNS